MCRDEIFWLERQLWGRVTRASSFVNHACSAAHFVQEALLSDLLLQVVEQDCQRGPAVGLDKMSSVGDLRPSQPFLPTQLWLSHSQSLHSLCGRQRATMACWSRPSVLTELCLGASYHLASHKRGAGEEGSEEEPIRDMSHD